MPASTKELVKYKGAIYDIASGKYAILKKGAVSDLNCIVDHFDVENVRFTMTDGCRIELKKVQDGDALPGKWINIYA